VKVYISVDMEGIGGISHSKPTDRDDVGYPAAVALMVGEANAAGLLTFPMPVALPPPGDYDVNGSHRCTVLVDGTIRLAATAQPGHVRLSFGTGRK